MLKQQLQQKLQQKLSPQQIQLIRLLELPAIELEERVKHELEDNPALEEGKEPVDDFERTESEEGGEEIPSVDTETDLSLGDYLTEDDIPDYKLREMTERAERKEDVPFSVSQSLNEFLLQQLGLRDLPDKQMKIAEYIIGNIDDDGYLRRDVENIVDDLAFGAGIEVDDEKIESLLRVVQRFDPAGVGASDLRECLWLQVKRRLAETSTPALVNARIILESYFEEFSKKHYEKISKRMRISDEELKEAVDEILKLNPKPGGTVADFSYGQQAEKIIPDFMLDLVDGELQLSLNSGDIPELKINKAYLNILEQYQKDQSPKNKKDVVSFVKYKLNSARSFIDAVQQRDNTLMLTMTAIVQFQKQFFLTGDETMLKPMILKDIADITGLDVSTISRVSNSKYVQTWFGIYALKDFFTGSMQTTSGEEVSTGELKNMLKKLVDDEDKKKPLTDDELVILMEKAGYQIARRTVTKYRQMLDIPVARLRREI